MIRVSLLLLLLAALNPQTTDRRTRIQGKPQPPPEYFRQIKNRQDVGNKVRLVLNSGATIAIEEHGMYPLVSIVTVVQAGADDEQETEKGHASLVASYLLNRAGFAKGVHKASGEARFKVGPRQTWFWSTGPAENLPRMLDLHANLLELPEEIKDEDLRQERKLAEQPLAESAAVSPAGVAASPRPVSEVSQAGIRKFHARLYRPSRTILVLSGSLTREQVLERIVGKWGKGKAEAFRRTRSQTAATSDGFAYRLIRQPVTQARVQFSYRVPGRDHADHWALRVLAHGLVGTAQHSLAGASNSGEAVMSDARLEADDRAGRLVLEVVPADDKVEAAEVNALAQLQILATESLAGEDLDRLTALALAEYYDQTEDLQSRSTAITEEELAGSAMDFGKAPARIQAVTADKLRQLAATYLTMENLSVVEILPESAPERTFTSEAFLDTLKILLPPAVAKFREKSILPPVERDRRERDQVSRFVPRYRPKQLRRTSVMRGPDVFYEEDHAAPLVHLGFYYTGGRSAETAENAGVTDVMLRAILLNAIEQKGAATWGDLERAGANLRVVNEPDLFGVQVRLLSPFLEQVFRMLIGWLRGPAITEESLQLARLQVRANQGLDPMAGLLSELWKDKPYGRPRYGTPESVGSFTLESVQAWTKAQMAERHPIIVIRGDFEGSSFLQGFVSTLSDRRYKSPLAEEQVEEETEEETEEELFGQAKAGGMFLFRGPGQGTRDGRILRVMQGILDGPGGELADELWVKANVAFPVSFSAVEGRKGSTIIARVQSLGQEAATEQALRGVFQRIQTQGLREDVFLAGLSRAITRHYIEQMDGGDRIFGIALQLISGVQVDQNSVLLSDLKEVQVEDIKAFAEDYLVGPSGGAQ